MLVSEHGGNTVETKMAERGWIYKKSVIGLLTIL